MSVRSVTVVPWDNIEAVDVYAGNFRQQIATSGSTLVRYTYHPACVFPVHQHLEQQLTIVHSGEIEFEVDGQTVALGAGQMANIPSNTPHGACVTGNEIVVIDNYVATANRSPLQVESEDV